MSPRRLVLILGSACLLFPGTSFGQATEEDEGEAAKPAGRAAKDDKSPDLARVVTGVVSRTNDFRRAEGRGTVAVNTQLAATARYFADFMARTDKYGHQADGSRPADRAKKHDYAYCIVSENIAYQFSSAGFATEELARGFFDGWKESAGHRKNMLDSDVTETGVAVARSEQSGHYYAVQMFGRPKALSVEFQLTNGSDAAIEYELGGRTFPLPPRYTRTHQRCRPEELTVRWPDMGGTAVVRPGNGDHYTVARDGAGKFAVTKK